MDCARETGCPHFGLLLGQRLNASSLGAVGFMVRNAPDVRTALGELAANLRLHNRAAAPYLEIAGRQAIFVYETLYPYAEGWEQIDDAAMGLLWKLMRALCGPDWCQGIRAMGIGSTCYLAQGGAAVTPLGRK